MTQKPKIITFDERHPWLGPLIWISTIQYFIVQLIVAAAWMTPSFSWARNTISDLGVAECTVTGEIVLCSPLAGVMNLSFLLLGACMALGALLIYQGFRPSKAAMIGFTLMALAGVGTLIVGTFPANTVSWLHGVGAVMAFLLGNISLVILALKLPLTKTMKYYTLASGLIGLGGIVLFLIGNPLGLATGTLERIVAYPQTIWLVVFGLYISADRYRKQNYRNK